MLHLNNTLNLSLRTNEADVFADLDRFAAAVFNVAAPRAANKLASQAQTAGLRAIGEVYRIGPRAFAKYVSTKLAAQGDPVAEITVKGKGLPLQLFDPRQTRAGVTVNIKGKRVLIPHAFIGRMPSGHVGVFARGGYGGKSKKFVASGEAFGRFLFGRTRLSINEFFTFSPPQAFSNAAVTEAMQARVKEQAAKVLAQEIRFAARG